MHPLFGTAEQQQFSPVEQQSYQQHNYGGQQFAPVQTQAPPPTSQSAPTGFYQPQQQQQQQVPQQVNYQNFQNFSGQPQQQPQQTLSPPPPVQEPPKQKQPLPEEFIYMQTVLDELKTQCTTAAGNPVSFKKLLMLRTLNYWNFFKTANKTKTWRRIEALGVALRPFTWKPGEINFYDELKAENWLHSILAFTKHTRIAQPTRAIDSNRRLRQRSRSPHADGLGTGLLEDRQLHARHQDPAATGPATSSVLALSTRAKHIDSIKNFNFPFFSWSFANVAESIFSVSICN